MSRRASQARRKAPAGVETRLLTESRRRCCLCVFLDQDWTEKQVQVAHISRDRSDSSYENLVVLCLNHHDQYDSRPNQSKGYKPEEVRVYKGKLTQFMQNWERGPRQFLPSSLASVIGGTEVLPLPTERLQLRGATEVGEASIRRVMAEIGQLGFDASIGEEWGLRAERLGGRSLLVGLLSQNQGDWLAWVAHFVPGSLMSPEVTFDILGQSHSRPVVRIIPHRDSYCLVVDRLTFHGTGAERRSEVWYIIHGKELVEVLEYPAYAHASGWCSFQREIRAIPLRAPKVLLHGASLEILFRADYSTDHFDASGHQVTHLFDEERLFHAVWDDDAELFVPTPTSQLRAADVEALFNDGDMEFFCRHRKIIEELLDSDVKERRLWAEVIHARYAAQVHADPASNEAEYRGN